MNLKIAIPAADGRLIGHLGETKQFALVEADRQNRVIVRAQIVAAPPHEPGSFPRWLREQGVQMIIVSNIGQRALDNLNHHGIEVCAGQAGTPVDALAAAYLDGHLAQTQTGCDHRHDSAAGNHACQLADYLQGQTPGS